MSRVWLANGWPHVLQGWVGTASLIEEIVSAYENQTLAVGIRLRQGRCEDCCSADSAGTRSDPHSTEKRLAIGRSSRLLPLVLFRATVHRRAQEAICVGATLVCFQVPVLQKS